MRKLMHMLVVLAVIWCGLHLSPYEADGGYAHESISADMHDAGDGSQRESDVGHIAHAAHSHCPIALDEFDISNLCAPADDDVAHVAGRAVVLASLSRPPPTQPPSI